MMKIKPGMLCKVKSALSGGYLPYLVTTVSFFGGVWTVGECWEERSWGVETAHPAPVHYIDQNTHKICESCMGKEFILAEWRLVPISDPGIALTEVKEEEHHGVD